MSDTIEIIDILKMFCADSSDTRYYLHKPFTKDGYTWATSGHMIVRVPIVDGIGDHEGTPNVSKVFNDAFSEKNMRPLMCAVPEIADNERDCEECDGRGTEHDCPDCKCECEYCNGSGRIKAKTSISVGGALFNAEYIKLLSSLPNLIIQGDPEKFKPMSFTFDGGCGLIMPLRSKYENHLEVQP